MNRELKKLHDGLVSTNSTPLKISLLKLYPGDKEELFKVLQYTYDKTKTYGVKFDNFSSAGKIQVSSGLFDLLDKLHTRQLTGNAARDEVEQFALTDGVLIKLICNKDLRCGISRTIINKAFPNCVYDFKVQLAKDVPLHNSMFPLIAQTKYDGVRLLAIKVKNKLTLKTRNGMTINLPKLTNQLLEVIPDNSVFDGELITGKEQRTKVSGLVNSAMHGGIVSETGLQFVVFDKLTYKEFMSHSCKDTYITRYKDLSILLKHCPSMISLSDWCVVNSVNEVQELFAHQLQNNEEGLILKPAHHYYTYKRSPDWIKMKAVKTADLICTQELQGTGKYENAIGALVLDGVVENKRVSVKVGSGLNDIQRVAFNSYVGQTIEVKYNELIQDSKTGNWSLFLPRFVCVRLDK